MFTYPGFNPIAIQIGPVQVHWYGIMYAIGFLSAWFLARFRNRSQTEPWPDAAISDLIFYGALGVILGGRLGYGLFYALPYWLENPLWIFKIWQGGMSFHGGLLGVLVALFVFCKRYHTSFFEVTDFVAPLAPIGLGAGRIGNFINGGLWGRPTTMPWGMVFPHVDNLPRHPSQLYELFLEGVLLFTLLWLYSAKPRPCKAVSGMFCLCYGLFRIFVEFFRQPDPQYGYLAFGWVTMGQILSLPMVFVGILLLWLSQRTQRTNP